MSAARQSHFEQFLLDALGLDGISVAREDSRVVATRDLTHEHGLLVATMQVDVPNGEARVILGGEQA